MRKYKRTVESVVIETISLASLPLESVGYSCSGFLTPRRRVRLTDGDAFLIDTDGKFIID